jgi:hypothetical protein
MANVVIDIAAEFTGKNAFKKAESATAGLEKGVKRLGKQIAAVFAAQKILAFGKASVKAFAADEKASKSLEIALRNTGNAFSTMDVEGFIAKLQRTTGVLDDELRPAFRTLLTATGDVKKSQEGLQLALDISAGTGKDLSAVSMALAKAYGGQTTALSRLGAGLDKATLKTGNMDVILGELNAKFSGQALAAVKTYSGQIAVLNVALQNAKETIGKGLLDSFSMLAGSNGLNGTVSGIQKMADFISDVIKNVAFMIKQFEKLKPVILAIGAVLLIAFAPMTAAIVAIVGLLAIAGKNLKKSSFAKGVIPNGMGNVSMTGGSNQNIIKDNNAIKTHTTLTKIDNSNTARKLALTGDQLALQELQKKYDVERIGLFAALNNATDEDTKMRLLSKIAIYDQNAALAGMITKSQETTKALDTFASSVIEAVKALTALVNAQLFKLNQQFPPTQQLLGTDTSQPYSVSNTPLYMGGPGDIPGLSGTRGFSMASANSPTIVVNVSGSVTTERDLVDAITQGIYNNQASGIPINYTTAY